MIIFDTETTGLLMPEVADLAAQPHIIEIAMVKLDDDYEEVDRYEALLKPPVPIDEELHKRISGLTTADLADACTFLDLYGELVDFFLGERIVIAHNLDFDKNMLVNELRRIGKEFAFPYPARQLCTVVESKHIKGRRMKMTELYEHLFKQPLKQKHRAMADVEALVEIVKKMRPV